MDGSFIGKLAIWLPRILAILYIGFISIFALDAFEGESSFLKKLLGFLIHLVPTFLLVIFLVIAWKTVGQASRLTYEMIGGILFLAAGVGFTFFFHTYKDRGRFLMFSLPLFVTGVLFLISSFIG